MSLILALDTSTDACSVALNVHGTVHSRLESAVKSHTQRLLPMVDELLAASGYELASLDAIAFGRGPGSFTGLRICAGVVQGLAFGANLPVIPVSTLAAMALGAYRAKPSLKLPVLAALDARMSEVYWGLYKQSAHGVASLTEEAVAPPQSMQSSTKVAELKGQFVGVGAGWNYLEMKELSPREIDEHSFPHAEDIAIIAAESFDAGHTFSALDAQPVYLRDSVSWQKRQRIRPV